MTDSRFEIRRNRVDTRPAPLPEATRAAARRAAARILVRNDPQASSEDLYELLAMLDLLPARARRR